MNKICSCHCLPWFVIVSIFISLLTPCESWLSPSNFYFPRIAYSRTQRHASQILEFVEPETGVTVTLIGSMHYNPASIRLATDTIQDLAEKNQLASVIIESCDIRYESSRRTPSWLKSILRSEMSAACDVSLAYGRPVILGDQRINITLSNLQYALQETMLDLIQPTNGGWSRIKTTLMDTWGKVSVPSESPYLTITSFLDPTLLLASPISLIKYPLSYIARAPVGSLLVILTLSGLMDLSDVTTSEMTVIHSNFGMEILASLCISFLEVLVFTRILLKEILHDRNIVLADSILSQCRLYQRRNPANVFEINPSFPWWKARSDKWNPGNSQSNIFYVQPSPASISFNGRDAGRLEDERSVVAVVGMAHCNGIHKILMERASIL
jgi:hypothetical protein